MLATCLVIYAVGVIPMFMIMTKVLHFDMESKAGRIMLRAFLSLIWPLFLSAIALMLAGFLACLAGEILILMLAFSGRGKGE